MCSYGECVTLAYDFDELPLQQASMANFFTHFYFIYAIASCFYCCVQFLCLLSYKRTGSGKGKTAERLFNIPEAFSRNIDWHFVYVVKHELGERREKTKLFKY